MAFRVYVDAVEAADAAVADLMGALVRGTAAAGLGAAAAGSPVDRFLHWGGMTRLTIEVPEDVAERTPAAAVDRDVAPEALAAEAVAERFAAERPLSFIGLVRSGYTDIGRRHDELLDGTFGTHTADG